MPEITTCPDQLFSPASANQTLPLVRRVVGDILDTGRQLRTLAKELGENFDDNAGVRQLKTALQELFDELANIGCSYRDWNFEIGLIDFPAVIEGDDVLLCWRSDEPELLYYHGIDEGYAGRKPIPESCRC